MVQHVLSAEPRALVRHKLKKYKEAILLKLAQVGEVVQLDIGEPNRPWTKYRGTWAEDDPEIEDWKKHVEEYRRQRDQELDALDAETQP